MILEAFFKTVHHFFPKLTSWLNKIDDPRQVNKTKYSPAHLLWLGVLLFLTRLPSKRKIKYLFSTEEFRKNLCLLTDGYNNTIAHHDTLENLLKKLCPEEISTVRHLMVTRLLRMKSLNKFRLLDKYYMIAIDGTGHLAFKERHCPYCLTKERDGKVVYYYHNVLEAKIVTQNGLALSIETEFIENSQVSAKQDCELKAFYRMVARLKKKFPQLKICLLLDSLYAKDTVLKLLASFGWKYIITFKEGSMPDTYCEYLSLKKLQKQNRVEVKSNDTTQNFSWVNDISYKGPFFDVLELNESKILSKGKTTNTKFVWLTNLKVNRTNFSEITKGGRLRWKIENEGFNTQKNRGYNLEHPYSLSEVAMKNYYLLLQIAHIISQLMEKGSLLKGKIEKIFGSVVNVFRLLLEELRTKFVSLEFLNSGSIQIRLKSPP